MKKKDINEYTYKKVHKRLLDQRFQTWSRYFSICIYLNGGTQLHGGTHLLSCFFLCWFVLNKLFKLHGGTDDSLEIETVDCNCRPFGVRDLLVLRYRLPIPRRDHLVPLPKSLHHLEEALLPGYHNLEKFKQPFK